MICKTSGGATITFKFLKKKKIMRFENKRGQNVKNEKKHDL
jgi:hypothetical protein